MRVAALDLGTNSFLCLVAEVESGEIKKIISDQVQIVRLGQDVNKTKRFHPEALQRAESCLKEFRKTIDLHQPDKILAMATSAARDVSNSGELFEIGTRLGIPIEVIPGGREAEISFHGSVSGFPRNSTKRAVIDIGGGSTEIIAGTFKEILGGFSVDIGALRLTEMFFPSQPPSSTQILELETHARTKLQPLFETIEKIQVQELVAVAGTPTELVAAKLGVFDSQKIDGYQLTVQALDQWVGQLSQKTAQQRVDELGISPGRADIILAGTLILRLILQSLRFSSVTVSTRGVRFGVALELEKRK